MKEGWEPLCRFLGVAVPETAFPRVNSRDETRKMLDALVAIEDSADISGTMSGEAQAMFKEHGE